MRKMLLAAMFVAVVGLFTAAPAIAADYPPSCANGATPAADGTCGAVGSTGANTDPTLYVAGASGEGALAFTGSNSTGPLAAVGIVTVSIGTVLVLASRRRAVQKS